MQGHLATTLLALVKLAVPPIAVLLLSQRLVPRLDDRGLLKVLPFPILPTLAAVALEWVLIRSSGLAPALDLRLVWTEPRWAVDLASLAERELAPAVLVERARLTLAGLRAEPVALAVVTLTTAVMGGMGWLAWRSPRAWRGLFLHLWLAAAAWLLLHYLVVLVYWTLHWLNFWIFFVLLAFVQMRRGEGSKHSPA